MNRFFKVICCLAIAGILAAPSWGAELVWVGGDSGGTQDITNSANWNPSGPGNNDSWFINTPSTGSYPIFSGIGTTDLTVWDVMLGRIDVWPRGGDPWHSTDPGYMKQEGGTIHVNATFQIGQGNNTTMSSYVMTGGVVQKSNNGWTKIGGESSLAELVLSGNAQYNQAGNWFVVGIDGGSNGSVTMTDTASINLQGEFMIGLRGATGSMTVGTDNTFYSRGWSAVGYDTGSMGTMTTSGTITHSAEPIFVGRNGASGTWNQIGGSTIFNDKFVIGGDNGGGSTTSTAILNISGGGLVSARQIGPWDNREFAIGNSSTINIDNGILRPYYKPDEPDRNADWLQKYSSVYIMAGGLTFDSNKNSATINAVLQDGSTQPNGTAGGGLTKTGVGNLTLTAPNTSYTGPTVIEAGQLTLAVGTDTYPQFSFATKNQITVRPGAALASDVKSYVITGVPTNADVTFDAKSIVSLAVSGTPYVVPLSVENISAGAGGGPAIVRLTGITSVAPSSGPVLYYTSKGTGAAAPTFIPWVDSVGQYDLAVSDSGSSIDLGITSAAGSRGWLSGTWNAGSWKETTVPGKYTGTPPASSPDKAWFDSTIATPGPVTLDIPVVLSSMLFTDSSSSGFTIAPATGTQSTNTITLSSSTAASAQIQVLAGAHEVSADIKMAAGDPLVTVIPGSSLTLSGALSDLVTGQPADITFDGQGSASGTEWTSITTTQGTLKLSGNNTFTGTIVMSGIGRLEIANGNALGAGSGNLVLNGTLAYTGSASVPTTVSTARGLTFAGGQTFADGENRNGSFNYIDIPANINLQFNGLTDIGTGFSALRKSGAGTLTFANAGVNTLSDCDIDIGEGAIVLDSGTFNKSRTNLYFQNNGGDIAVGDVGGKTGDLTIQNGAKLNSAGDINVGRWGGTGHLTITGANSSYTNTEASTFIGRDGGTGFVTVNGDGASLNCRYIAVGDNSTGTLTVTKGSANFSDELNVGRFTGNGHLVINGTTSAVVNSKVRTFIGRDSAPGDALVTGAGSVFNNQYLAVGDNSVASLTVENGGTVNVLNDNFDVGRNNDQVLGNGTVTTSGTINVVAGYHIFLGGVGATGIWNQNGGSTTMHNTVYLGEWDSDTAPGVGILNLNGGTLAVNSIKYSDWRDANAGGKQTDPATVLSTQTVNFNGGTLKALQNDGGFIFTKGSPNFHVYFKENGGTIDTNGFDVTAGLAFDSGAPSDGGMNKIGAGTLTVTGAIQYEGDTTVTAGALTAAGGINTPLAAVYVNTGSTLNATSIVADSLVIGGTHVPFAAATAASVPEPCTFVLLALAGLGALLIWRRK